MNIISDIYGETWQYKSKDWEEKPTILAGMAYLSALIRPNNKKIDREKIMDQTKETIKLMTDIYPPCPIEIIDSLECLRILGGKSIDIPTSFEFHLEELKKDPEAIELGKMINYMEERIIIHYNDKDWVIT